MSRPRGYLTDWNPRTKTRELLGQVEEVLDTYQAELPLTARQIFYRVPEGRERLRTAVGGTFEFPPCRTYPVRRNSR